MFQCENHCCYVPQAAFHDTLLLKKCPKTGFLPPSLEQDLGDKACALLHMAQSALPHSPSDGSRCPDLHLEPLSLAAQSPGECSNLLGVKRCSGVERTRGPGVKTHLRREEGTLGPLAGPRKVLDPHQSHIHHLRCRTGTEQSRHRHHLGQKERVSM